MKRIRLVAAVVLCALLTTGCTLVEDLRARFDALGEEIQEKYHWRNMDEMLSDIGQSLWDRQYDIAVETTEMTAPTEKAETDLADDVPAYVKAEAERVAAAVERLQNENTITFIALSDTHVGGGTINDSSLHAAQAARLIEELIPVDFSTVLGDIVWGAESDSRQLHLANHESALQTLALLEPTLRLAGNRDANIYNPESYLSAQEVYQYIGKYNVTAVQPDTEADRGYCYYDLEEKKLRIIALNTADLKDIPASDPRNGCHVSAHQLQWLEDTLMDMDDRAGWSILVLSHHPLHWGGSPAIVLSMLDDYAAGTSGSVSADGTEIYYDFTGRNEAGLIANIHGHTHNYISGTMGDSGIVRMATPNACYSRNNEYGLADVYDDLIRANYGETVTYAKTAGTAEDTAFCVYVIDPESRMIHAVHYGAGYDRKMSYAGEGYHSVVKSLEGVTLRSDTPGIVANGLSFYGELIPGENCVLTDVTVTMGGWDITDQVYADGVITIGQVTGVLYITAEAEEPAGNLLDQAVGAYSDERYNGGLGYRDDTYLSGEDVVPDKTGGSCSTGLIPYTIPAVGLPDTLYIRGVTIGQRDNRERIAIKSWQGKDSQGMFYINSLDFDDYFILEELGDQYYKLTPTATFDGSTSQLYATRGLRDTDYYIRFSFLGSGSDLEISTSPMED